MFCTYCGSQNSEGAKFCGNCGKPLVPIPTQNTIKSNPPNLNGSQKTDANMDDKKFGMSKKTFGIVLLIGGVLLFIFATSQISNMPPDFLMPAYFVDRNHTLIFIYHIIQLVGAAAAIYGGIQSYKNYI